MSSRRGIRRLRAAGALATAAWYGLGSAQAAAMRAHPSETPSVTRRHLVKKTKKANTAAGRGHGTKEQRWLDEHCSTREPPQGSCVEAGRRGQRNTKRTTSGKPGRAWPRHRGRCRRLFHRQSCVRPNSHARPAGQHRRPPSFQHARRRPRSQSLRVCGCTRLESCRPPSSADHHRGRITRWAAS